jgi:hypothetical protein
MEHNRISCFFVLARFFFLHLGGVHVCYAKKSFGAMTKIPNSGNNFGSLRVVKVTTNQLISSAAGQFVVFKAIFISIIQTPEIIFCLKRSSLLPRRFSSSPPS